MKIFGIHRLFLILFLPVVTAISFAVAEEKSSTVSQHSNQFGRCKQCAQLEAQRKLKEYQYLRSGPTSSTKSPSKAGVADFHEDK